MALITIPNTFSAGAVIVASQHNANFSVIVSDYNGNIDNTNIATSAAIAYSKLSLTGAILNADLAGSITDSKLSQITTASKVSGTSITGLASLPSGAGIIPSANLPAVTSPGVTLISNTAVSTAANTGDITIVATNFYEMKGVLRAFSADDSLVFRMNNDTGANYSSTTRGFAFDGTPTATNSAAAGATSIALGAVDAAAAAEQLTFSIRIYPQRNDSQTVYIKGEILGQDSSAVQYYRDISGIWSGGGAAVTSFRILASGGATFSGNVYLYKYALS